MVYRPKKVLKRPLKRKELSNDPQNVYSRERARKFREQGLCACGKKPREGRSQCENCRNSFKTYSIRLRSEMLNAYGHKCQCPGGCDVTEYEFLTLDHTNDNGAEHRAIVGFDGNAMCRWLKERGWPKDDFRLLCYNCNNAIWHRGYCAHETKIDWIDEL